MVVVPVVLVVSSSASGKGSRGCSTSVSSDCSE